LGQADGIGNNQVQGSSKVIKARKRMDPSKFIGHEDYYLS
jgi:hypothetical protein